MIYTPIFVVAALFIHLFSCMNIRLNGKNFTSHLIETKRRKISNSIWLRVRVSLFSTHIGHYSVFDHTLHKLLHSTHIKRTIKNEVHNKSISISVAILFA